MSIEKNFNSGSKSRQPKSPKTIKRSHRYLVLFLPGRNIYLYVSFVAHHVDFWSTLYPLSIDRFTLSMSSTNNPKQAN